MAKRAREPETAVIESVTHDGRGIAVLDGKKVFVAGALEGESVRFVRRKRRRNYDEAELLEVVTASSRRQSPRCAVFGTCGGCSLQHLSAGDQRDIKTRALADSLQRIGRVAPDRWLPPLHDEDGHWHYRRRARLAVKDVPGKGRVLVGFREQMAPFVCDMHRCEVLAEPAHDLIDPLSELIGRLAIRRRVPQVEVAVGDQATALVFRVLDDPGPADRALLAEFGARHGVDVAIQTGGPGTVEHLTAMRELSYALPEFDVRLAFDPTDFVQVNGYVNRRMVAQVLALLDVATQHAVLDLYCGIGNFSLPLARRSKRVLGIEGEAEQVERARHNARRNGIENAEFLQADLASLTGQERWLSEGWDRMLLDPARNGAESVVLHAGKLDVARIAYVSCHPGTLARDAGELVRQYGYRLEAAGIIDMFPHTGHVESLAIFQKN